MKHQQKTILKAIKHGVRLSLGLLPMLATGTDRDTLMTKLAEAKPGDVITLEAKTYQAGDLVLPDGVSLRGAGYDKTVLDAAHRKNGVSIKGGTGAMLSDLSVRNALENGIVVTGGSEMTIRRVQLTGNLTGLLFEHVKGGRVENVVIARNRTGACLSKNTNTVFVNCSLVANSAVAMTISGNNRGAIFNNLLANSPTAVYLTKDNVGLALDHNLYLASYLGKLEGEVARTTLPGWQRISGLDAHSITMPVDFADVSKDNYRPVSALLWAPDLATTSDWGVKKLGDFLAPRTDLCGSERIGATDLGAFEVSIPVTRKPTGSFKITSEDGVKSAALYDERGVQVVSLFQNQPLPKGRHNYWLPSRDNFNRPIPAGKYELRLVESQLNNRYLGLAGNFGASSDRLENCSWAEEMFVFDALDRLYILQNAFENGMGIRAFDAEYKTPRWMMPGGGNNIGGAMDATCLYYLQRVDKSQYNLRKINIETGVLEPVAPGQSNRLFTEPFSGDVYGMAFLNGRLYVSDPGKGKIFYSNAADPQFESSFDVPGALSVTADTKNGLLWVIDAQGKVLALDPVSGAVKASATPSAGIKRIAANNGRLATLSTATGKIQVYDIADPATLNPLLTVGTGDGPFGPQKPDRFWFQAGSQKSIKMNVALNSKGDVAVVDGVRVSFWGADGVLKKQGLGFWGQHNYLGRFTGDDDVRIWGVDGRYSIKMDCKNKSWAPDTYWDLPNYDFNTRSPRNFFSCGGKNFGVYEVRLGDPGKTEDGKLEITADRIPATKAAKSTRTHGYLVLRMDTRLAVPVSLYYFDSARKTMVEMHDSNKDGIIDARDEVKEIRKADGTKVNLPFDRYHGLPWDASGDLIFTRAKGLDNIGVRVKVDGLDLSGTYPVYGWVEPQVIPCTFDGKSASVISPYDYKGKEVLNGWVMQLAHLADGGYAASLGLKTSGGTGLGNGAGTDIAGFSKEGLFRWLFKLNYLQGSEGVQSVPECDLVLAMTSTQCDYMAMDGDGLGLGVLSMPPESRWGGMWSDHAQQQQAWLGNDGKPYYILGDYSVNGFHWFEVTGTDKVKRQRIPVTIDALTAAQLVALPGLTPQKLPEPPKTKVTIRRLAAPFAIDGDLKKWRTAGITPVLVTPDSGSADILGPKDCCAVIRLAYHGTDLYVQTLVFDDVVTMHQVAAKMYQQDGIEMGVNGFMQGFKYNVSITADRGPTVFRNKFAVKKSDMTYTPEQVPRAICVLDNARDVEERHYIEAVYGVDLVGSKVIVTEFKLPLTAEVGLEGDPTLIQTVGPGGTFWIGFYINDNDMRGGDVQKLLAWPATYGTFAVKECGALATFE